MEWQDRGLFKIPSRSPAGRRILFLFCRICRNPLRTTEIYPLVDRLKNEKNVRRKNDPLNMAPVSGAGELSQLTILRYLHSAKAIS